MHFFWSAGRVTTVDSAIPCTSVVGQAALWLLHQRCKFTNFWHTNNKQHQKYEATSIDIRNPLYCTSRICIFSISFRKCIFSIIYMSAYGEIYHLHDGVKACTGTSRPIGVVYNYTWSNSILHLWLCKCTNKYW